MVRYISWRLLAAVPVIIGVSILVFSMVRLVPGDPIDIMFSNLAPPTPEQRAEMLHEMGLDLPIHEQYIQYIWKALHGDLGRSYRTKRQVMDEILLRMPKTIMLTLVGLAIAVVLGVVAGVIAATNQGKWFDTVSMVAAIGGVSIPQFWLGLMLILLFGVQLRWFPVAGASTWKHLILPSFTLGVTASAILARLTRSSMLEVLNQPYVQTARAKGLSRFQVEFKHALKNALIPVITMVGLQVGGLLSGAFVIESVFGYPGVGELAVKALSTRDFPLIQGIVLLVSLIYVFVNLTVDLVYAFIDPKIRY